MCAKYERASFIWNIDLHFKCFAKPEMQQSTLQYMQKSSNSKTY